MFRRALELLHITPLKSGVSLSNTDLTMDKICQHIAFIMDGNRTWAKEKGLHSFEGHKSGYENAKEIIRIASNKGIPYVSFWALSDDNIRNRSKEEVAYLFALLTTQILDLAKEAKQNGNRIIIIGDRSLLPEACRENIEKAEDMTKDQKGTTAIIAIGYGGQEEIMRAIHAAAQSGKDMSNITLEAFTTHVESASYPPPDLIVRTGGHMRHSGFFLFQSPYAEYYFSQLNWPDFDESEFDKALHSFESRERKFGK